MLFSLDMVKMWVCTESTNLHRVIPSVHWSKVSRPQWTTYTSNISAHSFSFRWFCPHISSIHAALTAPSLYEGRQWAAVCFPVSSDLPSVMKHWKIIQVDDCWDSNRTFMKGTLYALKYFILCLSTAIKLKNRDWVTRVRAEIQAIIWTNQINKMNETRTKATRQTYLPFQVFKMV